MTYNDKKPCHLAMESTRFLAKESYVISAALHGY